LLSESRHLEQAAPVKSVGAWYWPALAASLAEDGPVPFLAPLGHGFQSLRVFAKETI